MWHFLRHYLEMVAAMLLGMVILGGAVGLVVDLPDSTGVELVAMAVWMTVPMTAWMRYRGHRWRVSGEMALAMVLPTAGVLGLLATGLVADEHTLIMVEHSLMFPAMFVAMLLRRAEYTAHRHGHDDCPMVPA
jgi:flagellar biosynthetic protein FliP